MVAWRPGSGGLERPGSKAQEAPRGWQSLPIWAGGCPNTFTGVKGGVTPGRNSINNLSHQAWSSKSVDARLPRLQLDQLGCRPGRSSSALS